MGPGTGDGWARWTPLLREEERGWDSRGICEDNNSMLHCTIQASPDLETGVMAKSARTG